MKFRFLAHAWATGKRQSIVRLARDAVHRAEMALRYRFGAAKRAMKMELRKLVTILIFVTIAAAECASQTECGRPAGAVEEPSTSLSNASSTMDSSTMDGSKTDGPAVSPPATLSPGAIFGIESSGPDPSSPAPSFFLAGINVSQGAERDPGDEQAHEPNLFSVTRVFGHLQMLKVRRRSETALNYVGGGSFYSGESGNQQLHRLAIGHRILWRRTQLTFGNSFGDLPGGSFGSSLFGGFLSSQMGFPVDSGLSDSFGSSEFGEPAQTSHITNVSVAALTEVLTPRASLSFAGAYAITDYLGDSDRFVNSRQVSARATYGYRLGPRDQIGMLFQYRRFRFPQSGAGEITTDVVQVSYARQISYRMSLSMGAGPEFVSFSNAANGDGPQISATGYAALSYLLRVTRLDLSYDRQMTRGSGFFAGANSDIVRFSAGRPMSRAWRASVDAGYTRSQRLQSSPIGIPGTSYQYGFAGISVERRLGRNASSFARYEFTDQSFDKATCALSGVCGRGGIRHTFAVGVNWQIRPIRLE